MDCKALLDVLDVNVGVDILKFLSLRKEPRSARSALADTPQDMRSSKDLGVNRQLRIAIKGI